MKKSVMLWTFALTILPGVAQAQNLFGQWQGMLHPRNGGDFRSVLKIVKAHSGGWSAKFYSIDQTADAIPVDSITLQGSKVKFSIAQIHASYEGTLAANGASVSGTWDQGWPLPMNFQHATAETAWVIDPSPHKTQFVTVDKGVKLEVLDWGGNGPPLVFLAGGGDTAHVFDKFALNFTATHHVYGITRRGFGASSAPPPTEENYAADRLGDDVLAVIAALKLDRPVLAGHSFAGEELSSIGSRYPEKVAGLIYLDAVSAASRYDGLQGSINIDTDELRRKLDQIDPVAPGATQQELGPLIQELLNVTLPKYEKDLQFQQDVLQAFPEKPAATPAPPITLQRRISNALIRGEQKYTVINSPALAIFATDPKPTSNDPAILKAWDNSVALTTARAKLFETGVASAHVVTIQNANHYIYRSNEADVEREMNTFMDKLLKS